MCTVSQAWSSVSKDPYSKEFPKEIINERFSDSDSDNIESTLFNESVSMLTQTDTFSKIKVAFVEFPSLLSELLGTGEFEAEAP